MRWTGNFFRRKNRGKEIERRAITAIADAGHFNVPFVRSQVFERPWNSGSGGIVLNLSFFKQKPYLTPGVVRLLAEQIIRDAASRGAGALRIKLYHKSTVLKSVDQAFFEIEDAASAPVQMRNRDMLVGLAIGSDPDAIPMMCIPPGLLLPLINTFAGQTSKKNNRRCFTVSGNTSEGDRYFDIKVILEDDATLSIEFEER
jgi:hypothetical protein